MQVPKIILFKYYTDKDNPADEYFAFVYEGRVKETVVMIENKAILENKKNDRGIKIKWHL